MNKETAPTAKRQKYKKHSLEIRRAILNAGYAGRDWQLVADAAGVPRSTAAAWFKSSSYEPKKRGGVNYRAKITDKISVNLKTWINEHPSITLKELAAKVQEKYNVSVSLQAIYKHIRK